MRQVVPGTTIYTDEARAYTHLPNHESVKHSVAEYVRGQVHTNGIESFLGDAEARSQGHLSPAQLQSICTAM